MNISVIIPVYNAGQFVRVAVESALYHNEVQEVILVEDGSTDNSLEICQELSIEFNSVKLFRHKKGINKGAGATRNLGIKNARQEYIAFLDADDTFNEIRFQKESEIFRKNSKCDGVYGAIGVKYYDEIGKEAWVRRGCSMETLTTVNKNIDPHLLFNFLIDYRNENNFKGYFSIIALTVKRRRLLALGILFDESLRLHQDSLIIFQLAHYLNLYTGEISQPIATRGVHAQNRYIHIPNLNLSQSKVRLALRNWAIVRKLDKNLIRFFNYTYLEKVLQSVKKWNRLFSYINLLRRDPVMRKQFNLSQLKLVLRLIFCRSQKKLKPYT